MTNYIIPSSTPSGQKVDLTGLTYPCRITDLRTGVEYIIESAGGDQIALSSSGSTSTAPSYGPTSDRPNYSEPSGVAYFDTDLGKPVWYNGDEWVDADGASVDSSGY